jgi:aminoglycoside phosphotransferase (APT) family kinase protein
MIIDPLSPELLQAIWNAHGLGKIERLVQPSRSMVNRCWIVNDAYVIRFDVLDDWGGIIRYASEKWAYETLRGSDVPVPQVLALDASKKLAPYDYLILTKIPGKTVTESLAELMPETQHNIAYTAGKYLATLHSQSDTFEGFGLLFEIAAGLSKPDWAAYVAEFYQDYGQQAQTLGVLPEGTLARVEAAMLKMQPLFAAVHQGRFVHGDYHFSNLLQQDGQITGVIDFEWALSGDPSWDFRIDDQLEAASPSSREAFYAGYTSRRALPDQHWERVSFYRIGLYLDYLATFSPHDAGETDRTLPLLLNELDWLEAHL